MWMNQAACADASIDVFFPVVGESATKAKRICEACPVSRECLEYALDLHVQHGIFGGFTARERYALRPRAYRRHGSRSKYQSGCRCDACREANARYGLRRRVSA